MRYKAIRSFCKALYVAELLGCLICRGVHGVRPLGEVFGREAVGKVHKQHIELHIIVLTG